MPDEPQLRCFVALDLPEPIRAEAERVQSELQKLDLFKGRYTAPDNIHLTLKFLGSIPLSTVEAVKSTLMNIHLNAPTIRLLSAGMFAPRIVWVKLEDADALQNAVDSALENHFKLETRLENQYSNGENKFAQEYIENRKQETIPDYSHVLQLGMTYDEVKKIRGNPKYIDKMNEPRRQFEMWTYPSDSITSRLYFENNMLVRIED